MADPKDLLAAERTLLAWIRTGIALMGFGFVVARFGVFLRELALVSGHQPTGTFRGELFGTVVIAGGIALNIWASLRYRQLIRRMQAGAAEVSMAGPVAVGVASGVGGLLLLAALSSSLLR